MKQKNLVLCKKILAIFLLLVQALFVLISFWLFFRVRIDNSLIFQSMEKNKYLIPLALSIITAVLFKGFEDYLYEIFGTERISKIAWVFRVLTHSLLGLSLISFLFGYAAWLLKLTIILAFVYFILEIALTDLFREGNHR